MTPKDKKIIEDAEKAGIPIFVLTAKDLLAADIIRSYGFACLTNHCPDEHIKGVAIRMREFHSWKAKNPDKVKLPD